MALSPQAAHGGYPAQHRQPESQRLARPSLGAAEDVATGKRVGQGAGLDRERRADVAGGQHPDQPVVEPELAERGGRRLRKLSRGSQGQVQLGPGLDVRHGPGWRAARGVLLRSRFPAVMSGRAAAPCGVRHLVLAPSLGLRPRHVRDVDDDGAANGRAGKRTTRTGDRAGHKPAGWRRICAASDERYQQPQCSRASRLGSREADAALPACQLMPARTAELAALGVILPA